MLKLVLRASFENSTPLLIGGYDTQAYSNLHMEGLRTQSIKGLIRWWARAYIAGEYWGRGIRGNELIDGVRKREDEIFGYVVDKGAEASKLALRVYINKRVKGSSEKDYNIKNIPRMRLLTLGGRDVRYLKHISGRLELYHFLYQKPDIDREIIGIGIKSLILSFLLSGVGKGSRRGFGTVELNILKDETGLFQGYNSRNLDYNGIKNIIWRILPKNGGKENIIPPIPTLAKGSFKLFYIKTEYEDPLRILSDLQGFTLRTQRQRTLNRDLLRSRLMAWVLGLPREMRRTGYMIPSSFRDKFSRRASPLIISIHRGYSLISMFKSSDWPSYVEWRGGRPHGKRDVRIYAQLNEAYELLISLMKEYLTRKGYEPMQVV